MDFLARLFGGIFISTIWEFLAVLFLITAFIFFIVRYLHFDGDGNLSAEEKVKIWLVCIVGGVILLVITALAVNYYS